MTNYLEITCPECSQRLRIQAEQASRSLRCGSCGETFQLPETPGNPFSSPQSEAMVPGSNTSVTPHRGGLILALAIVGWVVCPVVSIIAWILGRGDLQAMNAGRMDREGESLTKAGVIIAIINCALYVLTIFGFIVFGLVAAAARVAG